MILPILLAALAGATDRYDVPPLPVRVEQRRPPRWDQRERARARARRRAR